ncbi:hypothetical protein V0U79_08190 [Hyphobacterium sp. HN65]|uniref:DUF1328 domain-containing protein n=1 Tax=Hyphobacterium lacteum TaxID=3116575 RepID=A0ABU7LR05_9PROT|nr:hypothetical protein [Hyphobacterium sp. HN65]MEE2526343.1 hypothetical protein [Hyphobacterium sp. HN65]
MKFAIRLIIALLFAAFAYVISSIVLGTLMGAGIVSQIIAGLIAIGFFLIALFGKPGAGRSNHFNDNNFGGPGGPGPTTFN